MARTQSANAALTSLTRTVAKLGSDDVEHQYSEPARWQHALDPVIAGFERLNDAEKKEDAQNLLLRAYTIFSDAGLTAPARILFGKMARLAEDHGIRAAFDAVAPEALSVRTDYRGIGALSLKLVLAGVELESWCAYREKLKGDCGAIKRLIDTVKDLFDEAELTWCESPRRNLWRIHLAASQLSEYACTQNFGSGRTARELNTASRYLADYIAAIADPREISKSSEESPLRALTYGPRVALEEYLDLALPHKLVQLRSAIHCGDVDQFRQHAGDLGDGAGQLLCRIRDPEICGATFLKLLSVWRECWSELPCTPSTRRGCVLAAQFEPVAVTCDAMSLSLRSSSDSSRLIQLANDTEAFLRAHETKRSRGPGTALAPIWMATGGLIERAAEIEQDRDLGERALSMYLEAARLLTLTKYAPRFLLLDCLERIEGVVDDTQLEPSQEGVIHLARGYVALGVDDFSKARTHIETAGRSFADALSDPDLLGFQSLTHQVGKVYADAADLAELVGDTTGCIANLHRAAAVMTEAALLFKIPEAREAVLSSARKYGDKAKHKGNIG